MNKQQIEQAFTNTINSQCKTAVSVIIAPDRGATPEWVVAGEQADVQKVANWLGTNMGMVVTDRDDRIDPEDPEFRVWSLTRPE